MTLEEFLAELAALRPDLVPFEPYVIELRRGDTKLDFGFDCLNAAALIFLNDLMTAHELVQPYEGNVIADYLHGIIHRREGDFWNANYWFRQAKAMEEAIGSDAESLTDRVQKSEGVSPELRNELIDEWKSIVRYIINELK